jgi:hypothetical protein
MTKPNRLSQDDLQDIEKFLQTNLDSFDVCQKFIDLQNSFKEAKLDSVFREALILIFIEKLNKLNV